MTSDQYRAARALLNLTKAELAECASVRVQTIADVENGKKSVRPTTLGRLRGVLVSLGISFVDDDDGIGVRRRRTLAEIEVWEAKRAIRAKREQDIAALEPITPAQCRAARGFLNWNIAELSKKSNIGTNSLGRFEGGKQRLRRMTNLKRALERGGVAFTSDGGVRLKAVLPVS